MTKCTNCDGKGLVGQGEKPWEMQGSITTCSPCSGTGQIADVMPAGENRTTEEAEEIAKDDGTYPVEPENLEPADNGGNSGDETVAPAEETL